MASTPDSNFASGYSQAADWSIAVDEVLAQLGDSVGANLGFVYLSEHHVHAATAIIARLQLASGIADWSGCSALGVLSDRGAQLDAPGLAVLVAQLPKTSFRLFSGRRPLPRDFAATAAIVHGDPATPEIGELVSDMAFKVPSRRVAGGLASGREACALIAAEVLGGGLAGVAFTREVGLVSDLSQGYTALPGEYSVTAAHEHLIERLDDRDALGVYREVAGPLLADDIRRAARTLLLGLLEDGTENHRYTVRQVIGYDPTGGRLAINERVEAGQRVVFVRRDDGAARADMQRLVATLRAACPQPPRAALYVSCVARGGAVFESDEAEIELIRQGLGKSVPLAGFFAGGEIVGDRLYGYTGALTLFY